MHRRSAPLDAGTIPSSPPLSDRLVSIILAWQPLDRLLTGVMGYPRALMGVAGVCGIVIAIWSLTRFGDVIQDAEYRDSSFTVQDAYTHSSLAHPLPPVPDDMVRFLAAYNQASALAAMQGRVEMLSPYLTPDGPAWAGSDSGVCAARGDRRTPPGDAGALGGFWRATPHT
jgi:hypothetical protein